MGFSTDPTCRDSRPESGREVIGEKPAGGMFLPFWGLHWGLCFYLCFRPCFGPFDYSLGGVSDFV